MMLWETDTQRFVIRSSGAWSPVTQRIIVANNTARDAITTKYDGLMVYRQDRDWNEVYDGAAWRVVGTAHCTSVADRDGASGIASPYNGQLAVTTDTNTVWARQGGAWVDLFAGTTRLIGGTRRSTNTGNITSTETVYSTSGALALPASSLFFVRAVCNHFISVSGDEFEFRIREDTVSGNAIKTDFRDSVEFAGIPKTYEYMGFFVTTTALASKTFVATVKRSGGSGNIVAQADSAVLVNYLGPSSLLPTNNP
jgi:hypothetical protein